jgi:hypothetical protein
MLEFLHFYVMSAPVTEQDWELLSAKELLIDKIVVDLPDILLSLQTERTDLVNFEYSILEQQVEDEHKKVLNTLNTLQNTNDDVFEEEITFQGNEFEVILKHFESVSQYEPTYSNPVTRIEEIHFLCELVKDLSQKYKIMSARKQFEKSLSQSPDSSLERLSCLKKELSDLLLANVDNLKPRHNFTFL